MLNTVQLLRCRNMQPRRQFNGHLMRIWISVVLLIQWKQTLVLQSNKKSISVELSFQPSTLFFLLSFVKKKSDSWCRWAAGRILVWSNDLNRKNKRKKIKLNFKKTKEKKKLLNSLLLRCQQPSSSHCFPLSTSLLCLLSSSFAVLSCEWRLRTTVSAVVGELRRWRGL